MSYDQAAVNALLNAAKGHAEETGAFRSVVSHEPKAAPGSGLRAAIWVQHIRPIAASGLAATSAVVTLSVRVYLNMLEKPEDNIDPQVLAALSLLMDQYTGDFTFGGTIRNVDLLGINGEMLEAEMGYISIADVMYRHGTLIVPCVINDLWVLGGIPSAEETPGRSLQVDSLGVTGGANIGGVLTVGGALTASDSATVADGLTVTGGTSTDTLTVTGGLASGGLVISDVPSPSGTLPLGYGNSETLTGLQIVSSYPSDDVGGGTDGTGRINLYSYQRANSYSFGETIRNFLMRYDAKAMTAWYGPTGGSSGTLTAAYDGSGNATGSNWRPWTWAGSHYEANDDASIHGHYEIEIPDTTGALEGRLIIPFVDDNPNSPVYGQIGIEKTNIRINQADLTMDSGWGVIRVGGTAGVNDRVFELASSIYSSNTGAVRWRMLANNTAESGSNAGSDFVIRRFSDTGSLLGTGLFMQRSDGQIMTGSGTAGGARISVVWGTSGIHGFSAQPSSSPGSAAGFDAQMRATTDRAYQTAVVGDSNKRLVVNADGSMHWGSGSALADTDLYRNGVALLQTDGSLTLSGSSSNLTVGGTGHFSGMVGIGTTPTSFALDVVTGTSGQMFQVQRNSTSDGSPMAVFLAGDTSTSQAVGVSVVGDASSRFAVAPTGAIGWGAGTSSRDTFLSRTAAGQVTVTGNTTTDSEIKSLVVGDGTAGARSLSITSSYNGGNDDGGTGHYDSTGRIYLTSYQRAGTNSYGEVVRYGMQRWDAKAMHAWQFPQTYDGSGNPVGSLASKVWMGAHYEGTTDNPTDVHGHWSMEVPDAGHDGAQGVDELRTRFSINFCDVAAILAGTADVLGPGMGVDKTLISTNQADFLVRLGYTTYGVGARTGRAASVLRIKNDAGLTSDMEWGRADDSSNRRWVIRGMSADAESGANAGAAFQVIGYDDTGTILGTAFQLTRATGQLTLGVTSTYQGGLVVNRSTGTAVEAVNSATGGTSFYAHTADTTSRVLSGDVVGDANQRFVIYTTGQQEWGIGSTTRDTNLYRNAAGVLRTDTAFEVGTNLGVGTGPNAGAQRLTVLSGSTAGQLAQFKRTTTSDGNPVVIIETADTASGQSLGFLVTGDTTNRCGIDATGKITWGSGSATRDVELYRSSTGVVATDHWMRATQGFRLNTTDTGSGVGVIAMAPATTVPTTNPGSLGVVVYVDASGNLVCRTSAGNVRTLAAV
jgi:hypothetical protein